MTWIDGPFQEISHHNEGNKERNKNCKLLDRPERMENSYVIYSTYSCISVVTF